MSRFMQTCKQCGLELPVDEFKQYQSRSEGIRRTTTGRYTICKHCEKMSAYAAKLNKLHESGNITEGEAAERQALIDYYTDLVDRGLPPATKPVRQLLGIQEPPRRGAHSKVLEAIEEARRRQEASRAVKPEIEGYNDNASTTGEPTEMPLPIHVTASSKIDRGMSAAVNGMFKEVMQSTYVPTLSNDGPGMDRVDYLAVTDALDKLQSLLRAELVREPAYYEAECDEALQVLRGMSADGKVPEQHKDLANKVLERLDEYADTYEG